jgi:hypothetical protein
VSKKAWAHWQLRPGRAKKVRTRVRDRFRSGSGHGEACWGAGGNKPCTESVNRPFAPADIGLSSTPYLDNSQRFFDAFTIHSRLLDVPLAELVRVPHRQTELKFIGTGKTKVILNPLNLWDCRLTVEGGP